MQRRWEYRLRLFFFFNDTATTEIYTLSLHDALPISHERIRNSRRGSCDPSTELSLRIGPEQDDPARYGGRARCSDRSEEHTSELQSRLHLVCRLLLEKKKDTISLESRRLNRHSYTIA